MKIKINKKEWRRGLKDALPISISLLLFSGIFGVMAMQSGITPFEAVLMSASVFAGAAQFAALPMIADQASMITVFLTVFLLSSRYFLTSLSMSPYYAQFGSSFSNISAFFMSNEQYAVTYTHFSHYRSTKSYITAVSLFLYGSWILGTLIGTLISELIPGDPRTMGFSFTFTAMFLAMAFNQLSTKFLLFTFILCGLLSTYLATALPYSLHILISGIIAFFIGYFSYKEPEKAKGAAA